jgi:hypothetical protein
MNSGYRPPLPFGDSRRSDWNKRIDEIANRERRVGFTPNSLTIQTTDGVLHRPKPVDPGEGGGSDEPVWL